MKLFGDFREWSRERTFDGKMERCAVRSDQATVVFNWLKPGLPDLPPHQDPFDKLVFIVEGVMELTVDGTAYEMSAGSVLRIPAKASHSVRVMGEATVLEIDVVAPFQEAYAHLLRNPPHEDFGGGPGDYLIIGG